MRLLRRGFFQYNQCPYKTEGHQGRSWAPGLTMWRGNNIVADCKSRTEASEESSPAGTLILNFQSQNCEIRNLNMLPTSLWSLVMAALAKQYIPLEGLLPEDFYSSMPCASPESWLLYHFSPEISQDQLNRGAFSSLWISRAALSNSTFCNDGKTSELYKAVVTCHMWILRIWNVASVTEEEDFKSYLI